ncbi:unnamed protein product [Rangifer tarandus platyrhynchus]|uniref:Uncharacterized protein n=2 Tax=Rangifer tarandus platyrhynchus TaxID=3082113 RepID=A0ABN8Y3I4_RANTA|nr:unnamed protein product [Rangifer tarandus platyrhynchus]
MCQAGIGDPLTRWLLQNPFDGVGGVNPELLSIRQLVSVADGEGSGCNDAEARGPPSGHRVQSLRKVCHRPLPWSPLLRQDPFPIPCFSSTNSWNGLFGLGRARAGASSRARLSVWKACFIGSVQVQFGVSLLPSYKGWAFSANPMIHSLQYPTVPRNSLTWRGSWALVSAILFPSWPGLATFAPA